MKNYLIFLVGMIYISFSFSCEDSTINKKRPRPDFSKIFKKAMTPDMSFKLMSKKDFFSHFRYLVESKNLKKVFGLISNQEIDFETKNNMLEMLNYDFYQTFDKWSYNILFALCKKGFYGLVKLILEKYPTLINIVDLKQASLFHSAVLSENLDLINLMLNLNPSLINSLNKDKQNILHVISIRNKHKALNILLGKFEDLFEKFNIIDSLGNTPFEYAFFYGNLEIIKILSEKDESLLTSNIKSQLDSKNFDEGALLSKFVIKRINVDLNIDNANYASDEKETVPFYRALQMKNIGLIKFFITKKPELINYHDELGKSVLNYAIDLHSLDLVKFLINKDRTLLEKLDHNNLIPLHYAASAGNLEIVEYLLEENPASLNYLSIDNGYTVLHWAVFSKSIGLVKHLLEKEISLLYKQDSGGEAAIHLACSKGYTNIVALLLEKDINVLNIKTVDDYDPFLCAVHDNQISVVRQIIPHLNMDSDAGFEIIGRAAFLSCSKGYLRILKTLLFAYPDFLYIQSASRNNLFQHAVNTGRWNIINYLIQINPDFLTGGMSIKLKNIWNTL